MTTIAVIGMGDMGSGLAARLVEKGARVVTTLDGRSARSGERAAAAGVEVREGDAALAAAEIVLSVVPPAVAPAVAGRMRPHLMAASAAPVFVDCNAIAPSTVKDMAEPYAAAGLTFVDASIIGGPPRPGDVGPRLYMSGPAAAAAATLATHGLDARLVSEAIGDASALKMSYAGITKGFQALASAMALGAFRNGVGGALIEELRFSQGETYARLCRQLPGMYAKAYRWDGEMREIAKFLEPEAGSVAMLSGAADLFERIAKAFASGADSEIMEILNGFVSAEPATPGGDNVVRMSRRT